MGQSVGQLACNEGGNRWPSHQIDGSDQRQSEASSGVIGHLIDAISINLVPSRAISHLIDDDQRAREQRDWMSKRIVDGGEVVKGAAHEHEHAIGQRVRGVLGVH